MACLKCDQIRIINIKLVSSAGEYICLQCCQELCPEASISNIDQTETFFNDQLIRRRLYDYLRGF